MFVAIAISTVAAVIAVFALSLWADAPSPSREARGKISVSNDQVS
jgi:hypothetical protein